MVFQNKKQKALFVIAAIVGYGGIALVILIFYSLGGFRTNQAQKEFGSVFGSLSSLNAAKICDNGDNGHTIDNSVPWYTVYLKMPGDPEARLKQLAKSHGYDLVPSTQLIDNLANPDQATTNDSDFISYDPHNSYLTAKDSGKTVDAYIYRAGSAKTQCTNRWLQPEPVPSGYSIVQINVTLPDTSH